MFQSLKCNLISDNSYSDKSFTLCKYIHTNTHHEVKITCFSDICFQLATILHYLLYCSNKSQASLNIWQVGLLCAKINTMHLQDVTLF